MSFQWNRAFRWAQMFIKFLTAQRKEKLIKRNTLAFIIHSTVNGFYHMIETLPSILLSCPCSFTNISCLAEHFCMPQTKGVINCGVGKLPLNSSITAIYLAPNVKNANKPLTSKINYTYRASLAGSSILSCQGLLIIKEE